MPKRKPYQTASQQKRTFQAEKSYTCKLCEKRHRKDSIIGKEHRNWAKYA